MSRITRWHILIAKFCGMLVLACAVNATAQETRPYPQYFPDFFTSAKAQPWLQPDGKTLRVGSLSQDGPAHAIAVIRMNPDDTPDLGFGKVGMVRLTLWGAAEYGTSVVAQADGKILVGANAVDPAGVPACEYWAFCNNYIAIFRLNGDGTRDGSFNASGRLVLHAGDPIPGAEDWSERYLDHMAPQSDGNLLLYIAPAEGTGPAWARLLADGTLDRSFGGAYLAPKEFRYAVAVEFYNGLLDQYFVTADTDEIAGLDRSPDRGWRWAGSGFHVDPPGANATGTAPVCRFYGRPEAGLDSHVLSANADECAQLEAAAAEAWILESREAFRVELPDTGTGACAIGRAPVYRLWNGRRDSGHHLTIDRNLRDRLLARGYAAEGWGPDGVAMCAAH